MRRINTLQELRDEQKRLKSRREYLENEIKKEFKELREILTPMQILADTAKKTAEKKESHIMGSSAGSLAFMIAKATLSRSGILPRIIVPYLVRGVTSNLVEGNKDKIIRWAGKLGRILSGKKTLSNHKFAPDK